MTSDLKNINPDVVIDMTLGMEKGVGLLLGILIRLKGFHSVKNGRRKVIKG
jgi:hypothetical protein